MSAEPIDELSPIEGLKRDIELMERDNKLTQSITEHAKYLLKLHERLEQVERRVAEIAIHLGLAEPKLPTIQ